MYFKSMMQSSVLRVCPVDALWVAPQLGRRIILSQSGRYKQWCQHSPETSLLRWDILSGVFNLIKYAQSILLHWLAIKMNENRLSKSWSERTINTLALSMFSISACSRLNSTACSSDMFMLIQPPTRICGSDWRSRDVTQQSHQQQFKFSNKP